MLDDKLNQDIIYFMEGIKQGKYRQIRNVLVWVLVLNWAVALAKIIYGLFSRSTSITADGFHSLSDGTSNIIGLIGITIASQPKDKDHPYGHKKYETFFSLTIAGLLLIICFRLVEEGIKRLYSPVTPNIDILAFVVMIITLVVNIIVMRYERKKGELLNSDILVSDSLHTKADIFTSLSVIIALVFIRLGYPIVDPIVTLIIALFIAYESFKIIRNSSGVLCDTAVILDEKKIADIVLTVDGVLTCHKIRTRGRPDDIYVDLHVQVKPNMHIDKAHKISYTIEETIKKHIPEVSDVVVHMEPKSG